MPTIAQQWMQEGIESKEWMVVKSSLSMGLALETIAKIIGLPVKRIKEMKAQIDTGKK